MYHIPTYYEGTESLRMEDVPNGDLTRLVAGAQQRLALEAEQKGDLIDPNTIVIHITVTGRAL